MLLSSVIVMLLLQEATADLVTQTPAPEGRSLSTPLLVLAIVIPLLLATCVCCLCCAVFAFLITRSSKRARDRRLLADQEAQAPVGPVGASGAPGQMPVTRVESQEADDRWLWLLALGRGW